MSELTRRSGVPIPTIKYYLREGLLQPGEATAATRAEYGEPHLRRLRLIRVLIELGELPVASIRRIVGKLDDVTVGLHELLGAVQYALGPHVTPLTGDPEWQAADSEVNALITELGWQIAASSPARVLLSSAVAALRRLDYVPAGPRLRVYAETLGRLAAVEVAGVGSPAGKPASAANPAPAEVPVSAAEPISGGPVPAEELLPAEQPEPDQASNDMRVAERTAVVESAVAGMVLYERVLVALRRLAQEDASARRFGPAATT
ncbi:MAG TPA: MerR family transcriptional regulator [Streptosporangiaceae bacterium]|nr:MerR family transcriptional regulator [Streptosporangiaceae bacterium]